LLPTLNPKETLVQVSQRDGVDLDPHGLKYRPRQSDGEFGQRKTLGADVGKVQQGKPWGLMRTSGRYKFVNPRAWCDVGKVQ
jgi:hypothetical protein